MSETPPTVPSSHAERRDQYAARIYEHWNPGYEWADAHRDDRIGYGSDADVAMAAADAEAGRPVPTPTQADVYLEVADRLALFAATSAGKAATTAQIADKVRAWASQPGSAQPSLAAETVCICGHPQQQHFEDVCITEITGCNCGDYLPVEAAAEEVVRLRQIVRQNAELLRLAAEQSTNTEAPRRRLTPGEHSAAWHAIEGSAGEEGADPGTVLRAVLRALDIDAGDECERPAVVEQSDTQTREARHVGRKAKGCPAGGRG